jgi:hypothetical protein
VHGQYAEQHSDGKDAAQNAQRKPH